MAILSYDAETTKSSPKTELGTECSIFSNFKEHCCCNRFTPSTVSTGSSNIILDAIKYVHMRPIDLYLKV
ncbi:hypothetical protein RCL_jg5225.t1 [Rhizophagus clarus]|uniref:Uncharacterized protein n=1 Tax=Rhizophagus clarus TaxID=94130 RepID=A0A8H3QQD6_9GLOM|nr:hypothetical protein RCL_jg5225.t1 [Rhizophagus clarus]